MTSTARPLALMGCGARADLGDGHRLDVVLALEVLGCRPTISTSIELSRWRPGVWAHKQRPTGRRN